MRAARVKRAVALAGAGLRRGQGGKAGIAARLGALHGIPEKVGQLLALPSLSTADDAFARLALSSTGLPPSTARSELEAALGRPLDQVFSRIELTGIAASLGQVHRATLLDGAEVAVKLQYPGIADAVQVDLAVLGLVGGRYRRGYDLKGYRDRLEEMIRRELDYRLERAALEKLGELAAGDRRVEIPRVVPGLCTDRVLTMSWVDGLDLPAVLAAAPPVREAAARALVHFFARSVLEWGLVHGDWHPGNFRFQVLPGGEVRLGVLDLGCVHALDEGQAGGLRLLFDAVMSGDGGTPAHWLARYRAAGFDAGLLEPAADRLGALTRLLLAPLAAADRFDASRWALNEDMSGLLGEHRFAFRFAAPPALAFAIRAFLGLKQLVTALGVPVSWRDEVSGVLERSTVAAPPELRLSARPAPEKAPALSSRLRIRVRTAEGARIDLTFPAAAAASLGGLVPPRYLPELAARGIDPDELGRDAERRRFATGQLFTHHDPSRQISVWLE